MDEYGTFHVKENHRPWQLVECKDGPPDPALVSCFGEVQEDDVQVLADHIAEGAGKRGQTVSMSWCVGPCIHMMVKAVIMQISIPLGMFVGGFFTAPCASENTMLWRICLWLVFLPALSYRLYLEYSVLKHTTIPYLQTTRVWRIPLISSNVSFGSFFFFGFIVTVNNILSRATESLFTVTALRCELTPEQATLWNNHCSLEFWHVVLICWGLSFLYLLHTLFQLLPRPGEKLENEIVVPARFSECNHLKKQNDKTYVYNNVFGQKVVTGTLVHTLAESIMMATIANQNPIHAKARCRQAYEYLCSKISGDDVQLREAPNVSPRTLERCSSGPASAEVLTKLLHQYYQHMDSMLSRALLRSAYGLLLRNVIMIKIQVVLFGLQGGLESTQVLFPMSALFSIFVCFLAAVPHILFALDVMRMSGEVESCLDDLTLKLDSNAIEIAGFKRNMSNRKALLFMTLSVSIVGIILAFFELYQILVGTRDVRILPASLDFPIYIVSGVVVVAAAVFLSAGVA